MRKVWSVLEVVAAFMAVVFAAVLVIWLIQQIAEARGLSNQRVHGTAVQVERTAITYQDVDGRVRQVRWWGYTGPADTPSLLKPGETFELTVTNCSRISGTCDFDSLRVQLKAR